MLVAYYKMVMLSNEVKQRNNIKSNQRFDCIMFKGAYNGINPFVSHKAMFYLNLRPQKEFIKTDSKRLTEFSLTGGKSLNFTGLYFEDIQQPTFCYGYPNGKLKLSNGELNPVFQFRNDLYLFIVNKDFTEIEILVFQNCKNVASEYLQALIKGEFDNEIVRLRNEAQPFYNY
jgi:hypothetical protein